MKKRDPKTPLLKGLQNRFPEPPPGLEDRVLRAWEAESRESRSARGAAGWNWAHLLRWYLLPGLATAGLVPTYFYYQARHDPSPTPSASVGAPATGADALPESSVSARPSAGVAGRGGAPAPSMHEEDIPLEESGDEAAGVDVRLGRSGGGSIVKRPLGAPSTRPTQVGENGNASSAGAVGVAPGARVTEPAPPSAETDEQLPVAFALVYTGGELRWQIEATRVSIVDRVVLEAGATKAGPFREIVTLPADARRHTLPSLPSSESWVRVATVARKGLRRASQALRIRVNRVEITQMAVYYTNLMNISWAVPESVSVTLKELQLKRPTDADFKKQLSIGEPTLATVRHDPGLRYVQARVLYTTAAGESKLSPVATYCPDANGDAQVTQEDAAGVDVNGDGVLSDADAEFIKSLLAGDSSYLCPQ